MCSFPRTPGHTSAMRCTFTDMLVKEYMKYSVVCRNCFRNEKKDVIDGVMGLYLTHSFLKYIHKGKTERKYFDKKKKSYCITSKGYLG